MVTRALLTETERKVLAGEAGNSEYRSTVRSRLRDRLMELATDLRIPEAHEPELLERVRDVVEPPLEADGYSNR
jgi:hypothetical protein